MDVRGREREYAVEGSISKRRKCKNVVGTGEKENTGTWKKVRDMEVQEKK